MFPRIWIGILFGALLVGLAACGDAPPAGPPPAATALPPAATPPLEAAPETIFMPVIGGEQTTPPSPSPTPGAVAALSPTPAPTTTPTPAYPQYEGPPLRRAEMGVQVHIHREDLDLIFHHLHSLNLGWVKTQVSWKVHEPRQGQYDDYLFNELDQLVERANAAGIQVMLSVAKAPEWSRPTTEKDGPPADTAHFTEFMRYLAERYQGRVAAYELWNEPNLRREWTGSSLNAADFVALVAAGAAGVRAVDSQAVVISGAPATTGINDGLTAIDDRQYLQAMAAAGIGDVVDAVGVHPYGWANPPAASAADPDPVAPSHNNHPSFFFGDTLRDYRAILDQTGYPDMPLWATEFGWGTFEGFGAPPPEGAEFMNHVAEWQQAVYILEAFRMAQELAWVGPMILWNLNVAPTFGVGFSESGYSILGVDGSPRPAYFSLQAALTPSR